MMGFYFRYLYMLDANAVVEKLIPETTCVKRTNTFNTKCAPKGRNKWIRDSKCVRYKKFDQTCRNLKALQVAINKRCNDGSVASPSLPAIVNTSITPTPSHTTTLNRQGEETMSYTTANPALFSTEGSGNIKDL